MKIISWNVNGIRACLKKGLLDFISNEDPDIICFQETKAHSSQVDLALDQYHMYWNSALKKGYSGTLILSKEQPLQVCNDIGISIHDQEGRIIMAEYQTFYLVNVYTPNSKRNLERLDYRMEWEDAFKDYLLTLNASKPVIVCGDLNVAHQAIDLANPKTNERNAGYTIEERLKLTKLLESGFIDSYRYLYPHQVNKYTWWSYMQQVRERNIGWRIDYFLLSYKLKNNLKEALIYDKILGSDHCPIGIIINE
ncbi:MAG: exodeoxyribonuclease III [Bacilli bacterium]